MLIYCCIKSSFIQYYEIEHFQMMNITYYGVHALKFGKSEFYFLMMTYRKEFIGTLKTMTSKD